MKRIVSVLAVLIVLVGGWLYSQPAASIRVRLFSQEQPPAIRVSNDDGNSIELNAGTIRTFRSAGPLTIRRGNAAPVRITYPVEVSARNGRLLIVTELPPEDYIAAILAGESAGFRSDESLKAMAVAARTYALHFAHRHGAEGFDFCDATHCQDFRITAVSAHRTCSGVTPSGSCLRRAISASTWNAPNR